MSDNYDVSDAEREALVRCERTGEHQMIHRNDVENVTFRACPCGAIAVEVDGVFYPTADELVEAMGGPERALRIGAILRGESP